MFVTFITIRWRFLNFGPFRDTPAYILDLASRNFYQILQRENEKILPTFELRGSDGANYVWSTMFNRLKPKNGYSSSITKRWTLSSLFEVKKKDDWVCLMNNLVNLVKVWCSMFNVSSFEAKKSGVRVRSPIDERVRVSLMFEKWSSS